MRNILIAGVLVAAASAPAHAATASIVFQQGVYTPIAGQGPVDFFENFEAQVVGQPGTTTQPGNTGVGTNAIIRQGDNVGQAISPTSDLNNKYLAVGGNASGQGGTFTLTFGSSKQYLAFSFGTLDNYNSLTLNFSDGTSQVLTGSAIVGRSDTCPAGQSLCQYQPEITGRVNYYANGGVGINSVTFGSQIGSFEVDDIAAAAPEPATWAMMILGFGLAGASLRSRRRQGKLAIA